MPTVLAALADSKGALLFTSVVIGLICGSFVTAMSYRLPRGEDFVRGRSACPACGTSLRVKDLFPLVSWVFQRGRCRYCGARIPVRYPAIEAACAALFVAAVVAAPPDALMRLLLVWLLASALLALSVIDLEFKRLPNSLVFVAFVLVALIHLYDGGSPKNVLIFALTAGAAAYGLRMAGFLVLGKPGLGWGDVKLAAAVGGGLGQGEWFIFTSVLAVGLLVLVGAAVLRQRSPPVSLASQLAIGPAICIAAYAVSL